MVDNSNNAETTRERLLNNTINSKIERDRYTTPITIEFRQQKDKGFVNPAKLHRDVFAELLLIDSTTKMIINNGDTFTHPKKTPTREKIMQANSLRRLFIIKSITP